LFAGRPINIKQVMAQLFRTAKELGLPFGVREKTFNSRLAQELGKFAEQQQKGDDYHHAVFKAYFADGLNIGLQSTLADISATVGLTSEAVQEVLEKRLFKEAVDNDWTRSHQMGVNAVPTFMMNGMSLVGAQPYEKLAQMMETHGVNRRV
jgi:predicted DsbA family dithiol-disulfide isomerase